MNEEDTPQQRDQALERSRLHQVAIVGAGAAGLGCAAALKEFGVDDIVVLDRHEVGASFRRWPEEMRFITPSFTSNAFGLLDLNAIVPGTSPAYSLDREHPSGSAYAQYLDAVAQHYQLPVEPGVDVCSLTTEDDGTFTLTTTDRPVRAQHVIWAAGEFQYPERHSFTGAERCCLTAEVGTWQELEGDRFTVIGGHESAADATVSLVELQKNVTVLARTATWKSEEPDPSIALSPFTRERLARAHKTGFVDFVEDVNVTSVREDGDAWVVRDSDDREWASETRPILATGFAGIARPPRRHDRIQRGRRPRLHGRGRRIYDRAWPVHLRPDAPASGRELLLHLQVPPALRGSRQRDRAAPRNGHDGGR